MFTRVLPKLTRQVSCPIFSLRISLHQYNTQRLKQVETAGLHYKSTNTRARTLAVFAVFCRLRVTQSISQRSLRQEAVALTNAEAMGFGLLGKV
jgi:hypothetical protein